MPIPAKTLRAVTMSVAVALGSGCAHEEPGKVKLVELSRTVESLRAQNVAYERQVQELANRVFILNDQVESRKTGPVAAARPESPPLPKVVLHPEAHPRARSTSEEAEPPAD